MSMNGRDGEGGAWRKEGKTTEMKGNKSQCASLNMSSPTKMKGKTAVFERLMILDRYRKKVKLCLPGETDHQSHTS